MQIKGEEAERENYFSSYFTQYLIFFANIMGCKVRKYVGGSTLVGVRPIGGGYDPKTNCHP